MKRRKKPVKHRRRSTSNARALPAKSSAPLRQPPRKPGRAAQQEELERELRRLRAARAKLERRLTAAVQEIGTLRQWEIRATMLEGQLQKREQELVRLRQESEERIRELQSRLGGAAAAPAPG